MKDTRKLQAIINFKIDNGLLSQNYNNEVENIFNEYNEAVSINYKMKNNKKNKKMIYTKVKRAALKHNTHNEQNYENIEECEIVEDRYLKITNENLVEFSTNKKDETFHTKDSFIPKVLSTDEFSALEALLSLSEIGYRHAYTDQEKLLLENAGLSLDEKCAIDGLVSLCEKMELSAIQEKMLLENGGLSVDEKCALDGLVTLCEEMELTGIHPLGVTMDQEKIMAFLEEEIEKDSQLPNISQIGSTSEAATIELNGLKGTSEAATIELNENLTKNGAIIENKIDSEKVDYVRIEAILSNFICDLKGMFEKIIEKFENNITLAGKSDSNIENNTSFKDTKIHVSEGEVLNADIDVFVSSNEDAENICHKSNIVFCNKVKDSVTNTNSETVFKNSHESPKTSNLDSSHKLDDIQLEEISQIDLYYDRETLSPFETSDKSIDLEKFKKYRKNANPKEELSVDVKRSESSEKKCVRKFKNNFSDSEFQIDPNLVFNDQVENDLKLSSNTLLVDVIRQEYLKINNSCIISVYGIKKLLSGLLLYFYCSFPNCTTYRFKVNNDGKVLVARSAEIIHGEGEKRVAQIRGVARKIAKKALKGQSAYLYRKDEILKAADDIAKSGNLQNVQNLSTLRKCKSEGNADKWLDKDPFYEVFLMQQGMYKEYIQYVASPLTVFCWGKATFITFSVNPQILKDANYTIHFDASGQSVRQIPCAQKRVLVYKIVLRIKKEKMIVPVVTAILSRHTMNDICSILEKLKLYCTENKFKWPFFQRVCTDVSYALFGAVLKCCNNENISEYLMSCFNFLDNPGQYKKPKVILQWCKAHYIHIMCKDLNVKIGKRNSLRYLVKHALTMAFDLKTVEECKFWFRHIFTVLLFPKKNFTYWESYDILRKNKLSIADEDLENQNFVEHENLSNLESIAARSPFKKIFLNVFDDICNNIETNYIGGDCNEYKNEELCSFILNKYCPFLPLWTNIMGIFVDPSGDHITNAPVEFSFFLQKHIVLKRNSLRPGDFIRLDRKENISSLKDLRYRYNMFDKLEMDYEKCTELLLSEPNEENKVAHISQEHDYSRLSKEQITKLSEHLQPEEQWNKKDPRKRKSINPKQLLSAKKPKKFIKQETNTTKTIEILQDDSENHQNADSSVQIRYNLFRFNNLYTSVYPKHKISELGFYNFLDSEDWNSLKEGQRLTNFVLDIAIACFLKDNVKNFLSIPCQISEINVERVNKMLLNKPSLLFIPILQHGHFNICILKPATLEFIFIDSMYDNSERSKQSDQVNCGVFVILYVINFLRDLPMTNLPCPNNFRFELKSTLIKHADDHSQFCCHCYSNGNKNKCSHCNYHVCDNCNLSIYKNSFTTCKVCTDNILN